MRIANKFILHSIITLFFCFLVTAVLGASQTEKGLMPQNKAELAFNYGALYYADGKYSQAVKFFEVAALDGYSPAQYQLAVSYVKGQGLKQNYAKAKYWYEKSAAQGEAFSHHDLAMMYEGGLGVTQDYAKAAYLFEFAAKHGEAESQLFLAYHYCGGLGKQQDLIQCYAWLYSAIKNQDVYSALTSSDMAKAQRLANITFTQLSNEQKIHAAKLAGEYKREYVDPFVRNAY